MQGFAILTNENHKAIISLEWARGQECLQASEVVFQHGLYSRVAANAYYLMLHGARALLMSAGLQPKKHDDIAHLVNLHFVRAGRLDPITAAMLGDAFGARQSADYDAAAVFNKVTAERDLARAQTYVKAIELILRKAGYL